MGQDVFGKQVKLRPLKSTARMPSIEARINDTDEIHARPTNSVD